MSTVEMPLSEPISAQSPAESLVPETELFPYETETFFRNWWTHLACRFDIPVKGNELLIERKPLAKGLIQLKVARISGWNGAWNQRLTPARLRELMELNHTSPWDYFRVTLSESDRAALDLHELEKQGYRVLEQPAPCQYSIDLSSGLDGYLKGLSHNSRKNLKKKTRVAQTLNPTLVEVVDTNQIDSFFSELFTHHTRYWDEKAGSSYFHEPAERSFIVNWSKDLAREGKLRLDRLCMNGETVSLSMGILSGSQFHWLLTINTGLHLDYAPGIVGLYLRLETLAKQGVTHFHMGPGDYFYKIQCANQTTQSSDLIVINPSSLKGKLYYHWMKRQSEKTLP